jgi:hypothetical protein
MRMRRWPVAALPLLLLLPTGAAGDASAQVARRTPQRYEATGTVLQSRAHGPELCFAVAESYPPQCGGIPIRNWDWGKVTGEQSASGTIWGEFRLVGTYDGSVFTVEQVRAPRPSAEPDWPPPLSTTPCPEPPGGWHAANPRRPGPEALEAVTRTARAQPDFAGIWVDYLEPPGDNVAEDAGPFVLNAAFTGNLDRHRRELRAAWDGPLCVSRHPRTYRELERIAEELRGGTGRQLGLEVLSTGIVETTNSVDLTVVVLDDQARAALERRYGKGAVQATAELRPVG